MDGIRISHQISAYRQIKPKARETTGKEIKIFAQDMICPLLTFDWTWRFEHLCPSGVWNQFWNFGQARPSLLHWLGQEKAEIVLFCACWGWPRRNSVFRWPRRNRRNIWGCCTLYVFTSTLLGGCTQCAGATQLLFTAAFFFQTQPRFPRPPLFTARVVHPSWNSTWSQPSYSCSFLVPRYLQKRIASIIILKDIIIVTTMIEKDDICTE